VLTHEDKAVRVFALVEDGKIVKLLWPGIGAATFSLITPDTKILGTGAKVYERDLDGTHPTLQLAVGDKYSFEIYPSSTSFTVTNVHLLQQLTDAELSIEVSGSVTQPDGFSISGKNDTTTLRNLQALNGIQIPELEADLRPGRASQQGFIGPDERLLDILMTDNDYVLSRKTTHAEIAYPLRYVLAAIHKFQNHDFSLNLFGTRYSIVSFGTMGVQHSPFNDGESGRLCEIIVTNEDTGESVNFSDLHPEMIGRYGFYEGKGTNYRVEPEQILKVFPQVLTRQQ
jgi:hypothetical protein